MHGATPLRPLMLRYRCLFIAAKSLSKDFAVSILPHWWEIRQWQ
jgi:hypothetical protein